jgi:catechol 2,3-dioxygenase-like lactoylglutathione lyase family enzyme
MSDTPASCISHVSVGTNNMPAALVFYDAVLATVGCKRMMEHPMAVAYGRSFPEFWVHPPHDGGRATVGNGAHFAFLATTREQVDAFHRAALSAGGTCDGPPGGRALYGPQYYGAFVRDLDGNKIEAMYWDEAAAG